MKLKNIGLIIGLSAITAGCIAPTGSYNFDPNSLPSAVYNKYWAMESIDDVANVMQITPDGSSTLWRYSCDKLNNYRTKNKGDLGQLIEAIDSNTIQGKLAREFVKIERYKLETVGKNTFKLNAIVVGSISEVTIHSVSSNRMSATQKILGGLMGVKQLNYKQVPTFTKPLCAY